MSRASKIANNLLRNFGLQVSRYDPKLVLPPDITDIEREILKKASDFTMAGNARQLALIGAIRHLEEKNVPGDIVECGVWRGGSMMAAAMCLKSLKSSRRRIWMYDTFSGMVQPGANDVDYRGRVAAETILTKKDGWCLASLEEVRKNMASTGFPLDAISFVKGPVEETIPATLPDRIALLRLDTDWYESTRHELQHLYPLLVKGGVLILDDYGHWEGARKATDEYFTGKVDAPLLHRIDHIARIGVKP